MKLYDTIPAILAGTATVSALVITMPQPAVALTGTEVNDIARAVTVLFIGTQGHGSGVIISKNDKTYYVLTAHHVVMLEDDYKLVTADKQAYKIDYSKIKPLPGVDLALVEFTSDKDYQVAKLANSDLVQEGVPLFVSGWPEQGAVGEGQQLIRQFTDGRISGFLDQSVQGYRMIYTNVTRRGMSGGPVIDAGGRVVGIHGLGDYENMKKIMGMEGLTAEAATTIAGLIKPGFNYAIPINTFLQLAPQAGIYLNVQVENTAPPELGAPYVAAAQPDERDTIDDINKVLDTLDKIRGVGCRLGVCF